MSTFSFYTGSQVYEEVSSPEPEPVFLNFTINSVDLMEADEYSPVCNFNYCKKNGKSRNAHQSYFAISQLMY
jgi:hypothetical protein